MTNNLLKRILLRKYPEKTMTEKLKQLDKLDLIVEKLEDCRQIVHDFEVEKALTLSRFHIENSISYSIKATKELKFKIIEGDL